MKIRKIINQLKLGLLYPDYALHKFRKIVRGRGLIHLDYRLKSGYSLPPTTVSFNLTFLCNLRCKMCGQYGETGTYNDMDASTLKKMLSLDELKRVIDEISFAKPGIYIWGGEPFLHPNFIEFVEYIKKKKLNCVVNTNGTLLERYAVQLVDIGLDSIDLSIDGPQSVHDEIRGVSGTFQKVVAGIEAISRAKKSGRTKRPFIKLISVITENNYEHLDQIIQIAKNYDINYIEFAYGWFVNQTMGEKTDKLFQKNFQCNSTSWKGFLIDSHSLKDRNLKKIVQRIKEERSNGLFINFAPDVDLEYIDEYYRNPQYIPGQKKCVSPWLRADIRPDGDVTPCSSFPDYIAGNVREENFLDIWNGQRFKKYRQVLRKNKVFPVCSRCCGLYNY
ncbi:MAG: radical SAM protein [Candidatus Scalindua rubra]|uniref:Radical SAM core domain-containing protein n=1 Tax=Candidatus Scalindua brodae TaxID=237368 RepID=A0A0B0ECD9_9BACT|nr:MAG: hypothetical protein SCABRO_03406 [Candidatus Scalindua brodae]MBZ0108455.1 radical SAM protein [Candidatus Scalindua rubra]TWU28814.1 Antilisterial bacteriocin subtilosin biosynthesis protein AlbA [Candidatus Brocadiaceae bacterium S225]